MARVGTCPVLTERAGEKTGHIMISQREYCKKCPPQRSSLSSRSMCSREHMTYRACKSCGNFEQRDWHPCDQITSRYIGNWPSYGYCDKKAVELRDECTDLIGGRERGKRWLCKQHFPENIERRRIERDRRGSAKFEAQMDASRYGWVGRGYEKILLEMSNWMAANPELVAEDEWLGKITKMMTDNEQLMKVMGVRDGSA